MKRRVSWACLAGAMVLSPLALIGCGDDDDNNPSNSGSGGSAGSNPMQGSGGGPMMGGGGSSGGPGACTPSTGLTRAAGQACGDSQLVCGQAVEFENPAGVDPNAIRVELRGDYLPDTSWGTGVFMDYDATSNKWKTTIEGKPGVEINYKFYYWEIAKGFNTGTWVGDGDNNFKATPPSDCAKTCATYSEKWSLKDSCAAPPPPKAGQQFDWRDSVMYFVFVDRFRNGDPSNDAPITTPLNAAHKPGDYQGGDYAGVIEKINDGYFESLGVNTLWLTVPFDNPDDYISPTAHLDPTRPPGYCDAAGTSGDPACYPYTGYHGYWPMDQWPLGVGQNRTEEHFGTEDELKALVAAAHAKNLKVLFDYAMVHLHEESPIYQDAINNPASQFKDWFTPKYAVNEAGNYIDKDGKVILDPTTQQPYSSTTIRNPEAPGTPQTLADNKYACTCGSAVCGWDGTYDNPSIGERCWFQGYLPHLNYKNQAAREYSLGSAVRFIKEIGADGFRLDAVKHIDKLWYQGLRTELKNYLATTPGLENERFYLVGETYDFNGRYNLDRFINPDTQLDGQFDFPARAQLARAVLKRKEGSSMSTFARFMETNDTYYGCDAVMSTWIGNHDVHRAIHIADDTLKDDPVLGQLGFDEYSNGFRADLNLWSAWQNLPPQPAAAEPYERMANAYAVLMTNPGAPLIYYGDEYGIAGGGDPDNRRMLFGDSPTFTPANAHQTALFERLKRLTAVRAKNPALRRGARTTINASDDVWVYKMTLADPANEVFVAVNRADTAAASCDLEPGTYHDEITDTDVEISTLEIPARQTRILVRK